MVVGFRNRFRICELFGIPVFLDLSFAVLLVLFLLGGGTVARGFAMALALAISVVLHELGHSLTARAFGYRTSDITISLLGGCASMIALPRKPWQEFLTALAGPLVSLLIATLAFVGIGVIGEGSPLALGWGMMWSDSLTCWASGKDYLFLIGREVIYTCPADAFWMVEALLDLGCLNLMLGFFNLLPGFPLDGGRIFRSTLCAFVSRPKATFAAMWVGRGFAILLALRGVYLILSGGNWGFISILIALMIWREGYREYLISRVENDFSRWTQKDFDAKVSPPPYDR